MFCEKCGEQLKDDALFCQNCGAKVERKTPKKMVRRYYILFAIAIVCAISIIIVNNVFFKSNNEEDFVGEDEITSVETNPVFTETESVTEEKNEQIKTKETYRNFMVTERYKYEYDQNGNIIAIYADMDGYGLKLASNSEYDYKGNKIKTVCYNNGNPYQWEIYTYDNANLLSQKTYDIDNQLVDEYTYSYDDKNRLIEKKHSYQDYTSYVIRYVYDNLGNQIEETTNYNENPLGDFTRCQYDEHGNIVKKENGRGEKINNYSEYSYNVKGQLIESRYYLGDELSLSSIATYDYDLNGNVIRENIDNFTRTKSTSNSEYVTKKETSVSEYQYDENNNKIAAYFYKNMQLSSSCEYQYDEKGNIVMECCNDKSGDPLGSFVYRYEYKYDEKGNLIGCYQYDDDWLMYSEEMTYY